MCLVTSTFRVFPDVQLVRLSRQGLLILHRFFVPQEESLAMVPAEETWALPEEFQAGGLVEGFTNNKAAWYGILTLTFLFSNIDESAQSYISDKMTEEEDDAYDFSTDYV